MDALPGLWSLTPIGALVGIVVLCFWLLATGRVMTRSQHDEIVALWKAAAERWESASSKSESTLAEAVKTLGITGDFFKRIGFRPGGGDDDAEPS